MTYGRESEVSLGSFLRSPVWLLSRPPQPNPEDKALQELQELFGANLRAARQSRDMTQDDLSRASGTARTYISLVEKGQKNLMMATAVSLASAVGKTVPELLLPLGQAAESPPQLIPASGVMPHEEGALAVELPAGQAFEVALDASKKFGRAVPLIEPRTREVKAVVPKP
jgi:transcriptional regulator with XRE-family HTH domain